MADMLTTELVKSGKYTVIERQEIDQIMQEQNLPDKARRLGDHILEGLREALHTVDAVREIRHKGCMIGIELDRPCGELVSQALGAGLLINVTAGNVIRLLPPLIMNNEEADALVTGLAAAVREFLA